jgi:hypothetical protein
MPNFQDITIFSIDDDEVPLLGTVVGGVITEASFSTDPDHPRPYLKPFGDIGESMVDFLAGGSVIGQMSVELLDVPLDETDQDTGIVTFYAATASGDTALLGVRFVAREWSEALNDYEIVFDGVCGPITMPKLTTFKLQLRDARERERQLKLFNTNTDTCVFPAIGPKEGWGFNTEYDPGSGYDLDGDGFVEVGDPVMPRVKGASCIYRDEFPNGFFALSFPVKIDSDEYYELLTKMGQPSAHHAAFDDRFTFLESFFFDTLIVEWSLTGEPGTYKAVGPMVQDVLFAQTHNLFEIKPLRVHGEDARYLTAIAFQPSAEDIAAGKKPANGAHVFVRVVSNVAPTEQVPLFLEERVGQVVKNSYDGVYTRAAAMIPVRYDAARMQSFIQRSPIILARITAPVEDGRSWLQENCYRIMLAAPSIRDGKVYPIYFEIPDENEELIQLDDSNTVSADWIHGPDNIVNQVVFDYEREIVPTTTPQFAKPRIQKVYLERNRLTEDSQRRHGTKPQVFKAVTLRSVLSEADAFNRIPAHEVAGLIFMRVSEEILRRMTNGAQIVSAVCTRTEDVDDLQEGRWVIGAWSWLPNYATRERGMNRLLQVMKVRRGKSHLREFLLLDAGPHDQPIDQPTVDLLTENDNGSVTIAVSGVPADGRAEVQYAIGEVEPEANSGQWYTCDYLDEDGDAVTLPFLWPAGLVWARARGTQDGRRASAWTAPISLRLDDEALIRHMTLTIEKDPDATNEEYPFPESTYGMPVVTWEPLEGTAGVKAYYEVHEKDSDPPDILTNEIDFDASDLTGVIPVVLRQWERVTVVLEAYPEWDGVAVGGIAGASSLRRTVARVEDHYVKPSIGELLDRSDDYIGRLTLEILDSQLQITSIWFRTREGSGDASVWTAFTEDVVAPYGAEVAILPGQSSAVGYEVYAYDHAGRERLFKSGTVEFPFEGLPSLLLRVDDGSGGSPTTEAYFDVAAADPVPQGTDSITLIATPTGCTISSPAGIETPGVGTGDPTNDLDTTDIVAVVADRPPFGDPDGEILFHIEADDRTAVETIVTVPAQVDPTGPTTIIDIDAVLDSAATDTIEITWGATGGPWDHFKVFVEPVGYGPEVSAGETGAMSLIFDTSIFGWDLGPGLNTRSLFVRIEAHNAVHTVLGQDTGGQFDFAAFDDV